MSVENRTESEPSSSPNGPALAIASPADLAEKPCQAGYLPDEGLVTAAFLAVRMHSYDALRGLAEVIAR